VVLARELSRPLKLLVVAQPTRGLDVGSMEFVHRRIVTERDNGAAVVVVSTELDEVLGLADRIGVMYRGKIIGEMPGGASPEAVGLLMAGTVEQDAAGNHKEATSS
jgi:simple sugar transport system ATP-binding protein